MPRSAETPDQTAVAASTPADSSAARLGFAGEPPWVGWAVLAAAVIVVGITAWRAGLGIATGDDAYYAVVPLRLAQGARPLADEMSAQSLGFLLAVPFTKLWTLLWGTSGLVYALRLFYVALASVAGYVVFRLLRPSFGSVASALAPGVLILAPPYNIIGLSYNTSAELGLLLALAFLFAGVRDRDWRYAAAAGASSVFAAISYPPLGMGALVFLAVGSLVAHERRLVLALLGGAAAAGAALVLAIVGWASPSGISHAFAYSSSLQNSIPPAMRWPRLVTRTREALSTRGLLAFWVLVVAASLPRIDRRLRGTLALALPFAAAYPGIAWLVRGHDPRHFGTLGAATLYVFVAGGIVVVSAWTLEAGQHDLGRLLLLAAPMGIVSAGVVGFFTSSGADRVVSIVGLAPLVVAIVVGWVLMVTDGLGRGAASLAAVGLLALLVFQLFSFTFNDAKALELRTRITSGPLAGLATTAPRAAAFEGISRRSSRWVKPYTPVLVMGSPILYLLIGGRIDTNAVWLATGPSDRVSLDYYRRNGQLPEVAFVSAAVMEAARHSPDPLVAYLVAHYRVVDHVHGYSVFKRQ